MDIGVSTASYFGKLLTEEAFDILNQNKIPVCEAFLTTFSEYEPKFIEELRRRQKNLEVYSVHALTSNFEPQLYNRADRTYQDALEIFDKVASAGQMLGARVYTFHGGFALKRNTKYDIEFVGKRTKELSDRAKAQGIVLAYENVHWAYYSFPEYITELIKYAPDIHTCLDIKQAMQSGYGYADFLDKMKGRLANVHLCDYDDDGRLSVCGKGKVDFYELFCRLIDSGYDKVCLMEVYSKDYASFEEVTAGYEYLLNTYYRAKRVR